MTTPKEAFEPREDPLLFEHIATVIFQFENLNQCSQKEIGVRYIAVAINGLIKIKSVIRKRHTNDFYGYCTRSRNNIRKSTANRKWGHWSSMNFSSEIWNRLDPAIREAKSLTAFKRGLSKAIL